MKTHQFVAAALIAAVSTLVAPLAQAATPGQFAQAGRAARIAQGSSIGAGCRPNDVENLGYVSNLADNTVSVIDLAHDKVVGTIPGFNYPFNQEITNDGSTLFVDNSRFTNPFADTLAEVNLCTRTIVRSIRDPGVPFSSLQRDGALLYSTPSLSPDLPILEIDPTTGDIVRKIPAPLGALHATSYDGKVIWISSLPDLIWSYNGTTLKRFGGPILSCGAPAVLRLSPDGKYLISLDTEDCLTIVNTVTRHATHLFTGLFGNPAFGSFTPDGRYFWAGGYSGKVWVVDMSTLKIVKTIAAGGFSVGVNFSRDGTRAYVSTTPPGTVSPPTDLVTLALAIADVWKPGGLIQVYNTNTYTKIDQFKVGNVPMLISIPPGPFATTPPITPQCPTPTGQLRGTQLGPLGLGLTQSQARTRLPRATALGDGFTDHCLSGRGGIRVAYPSRRLLRTLPRRQRAEVRGRIVIALTSNTYYALDGIRPGTRLAAAAHKLRVGRPLHIGKNNWYLVPGKVATGLLKVRHDVIEEIGIANKRLTETRHAALTFMSSFRSAL